MNKDKIWLSTPHMGGAEQKFVQDAFDENWIAPLGPNVIGFESDLKSYLMTEKDQQIEVAALSSGTAALHLALIILGVKSGDEVICQSMTFAASANPIVYLGATPVFIDSEIDTLNLCPNALEEAIKDRISLGKTPKAIIGVHLYGTPYKIREVHAIARKYGIPVVEDSAEALGSSYYGQKCGTFGDLNVLSFNGNKIITTSGGGALVTKNKNSKDRAIFLATQARDDAPYYQHSVIGYNYRLSNVCAGIGRGQMEVLDYRVAARRGMHQFYVNLFNDIDGVNVHNSPSEEIFSNHWLSVVLFDDKNSNAGSSEDLRLFLADRNIESRPLWKPMHMQPVFKDAPYYGNKVAEELFERGLCLPSGSDLTDSEKDRIKSAIQEFFKDKR